MRDDSIDIDLPKYVTEKKYPTPTIARRWFEDDRYGQVRTPDGRTIKVWCPIRVPKGMTPRQWKKEWRERILKGRGGLAQSANPGLWIDHTATRASHWHRRGWTADGRSVFYFDRDDVEQEQEEVWP